MRSYTGFFLLIFLCLTGCQTTQTVCPTTTGTPQYIMVSPEDLQHASPAADTEPLNVEINGKNLYVDKIIERPLCNDHWSGTIYVGCDVQVYEYLEEDPLFLEKCNLEIEPGTVVYVAYHNNAAYYKGCSCHTGDEPSP